MAIKKKLKAALVFVLDIVLNVVILFAFVFAIREFIVAPFQIFGPSMCDTLNDYNGECQNGFGEYIILNKFTYLHAGGLKVGEPERYDIVVFHPPQDKKVFFIKRVIGLPGETVEIKSGKVFINGEKLEEPYLDEENMGNTKAYDKSVFQVPEGRYFVLGDNRTRSSDSRTCFEETRKKCENNEDNHYLTIKNIQGKAWVVLWPFEFARVLDYPEINS